MCICSLSARHTPRCANIIIINDNDSLVTSLTLTLARCTNSCNINEWQLSVHVCVCESQIPPAAEKEGRQTGSRVVWQTERRGIRRDSVRKRKKRKRGRWRQVNKKKMMIWRFAIEMREKDKKGEKRKRAASAPAPFKTMWQKKEDACAAAWIYYTNKILLGAL